MNFNFVLNTLSLPASNPEQAYNLMFDAIQGMFALSSGNDRFALYSSALDDNLIDSLLSDDYSYNDFLDQLLEEGENDIHMALLDIEDKTPTFNAIQNQIDSIANSAYFFPDRPYTGSVDLLAIAWNLDAYLLSSATSDRWRSLKITFSQYTPESPPAKELPYIYNISCEAHGEELFSIFNPQIPFEQFFENCQFSNIFLDWLNKLHPSLQQRIKNKFHLATDKQFQGGEPLFKTLENANGIREMRFNAIEGGAVRILFKQLSDQRFYILYGFIKKSDNEGYDFAIQKSTELLQKISS